MQPLSVQAEAARGAINPETSSVVQYIAPRADDMVAVFRVNNEGKATMVAVDPYTAKWSTPCRAIRVGITLWMKSTAI